MKETLIIANSPMMWVLSVAIISVVVVQVLIFYRLAKHFVKDTNVLTDDEVRKSLRIGVIGTLGPAMAVFAIAVALIAQIGGPITLARVGVIGSAAFEMIAAKLGSAGTVATPDFTPQMLSAAAWVMTIGGSGWLIMVLLTNKKLDSFHEAAQRSNPLIIGYMSTFAPFVIFLTLSYKEVSKGLESSTAAPLAALVAGAVVMYIIKTAAARNESMKWMKEWAMGFAVIAGMIVGSIVG
ncbi:hypothetical protein EAL2_c17070 [Peptoclostridium acidaminophilum DSM 3953]|uniref:DUF5058 domain-containing protein n=1 Tax=Peptoclostridium acidaminophilum DSM 3953 TaxID=1286171 RepID=W8TLC6_PEPAC|nr:DUF5058 family protein [Peptoclostridium acidaminophilum]AHM57002.1 hypothetical protein EAL2_c17070 [Peptoclostridium acidaminophilum DSM 3953]